MGLILPLLFLGLMASLSPATIVVFLLVLGTAKARVNAVGFLFGRRKRAHPAADLADELQAALARLLSS